MVIVPCFTLSWLVAHSHGNGEAIAIMTPSPLHNSAIFQHEKAEPASARIDCGLSKGECSQDRDMLFSSQAQDD